jgi:hypothetical protein
MGYGIKVSKPGFDVTNCIDAHLIMSSSFNMLKAKAANLNTGSYTHGLPYTPMFFTIRRTMLDNPGRISTIGDDAYSYCDSTNLTSTRSDGLKFYVFYQQGI